MQKTRQQILDVLNRNGASTVSEITEVLKERRGDSITAVTVRHHLNLLQKQQLIATSEARRREQPGRPQHVYVLTENAHEHFPSNYPQLASGIIQQLKTRLQPEQVNVIFEGLADDMAAAAHIPDTSLTERLNMAVNYLSDQGYAASWESSDEGYVLHTSNCPYHEIAQIDETLCNMDMRLISSLIGIVPRRVSRVACGDSTCSYLFPTSAN